MAITKNNLSSELESNVEVSNRFNLAVLDLWSGNYNEAVSKFSQCGIDNDILTRIMHVIESQDLYCINFRDTDITPLALKDRILSIIYEDDNRTLILSNIFRKNPELENQLFATACKPLVCPGDLPYPFDNSNNTQQDKLSESLLLVRQCEEVKRWNGIINHEHFSNDIISLILSQCSLNNDPKGFTRFMNTNRDLRKKLELFHQSLGMISQESIWSINDIKMDSISCFPVRNFHELHVLDAKTFGLESDAEQPPINIPKLREWHKILSPRIMCYDPNLSYLVMDKHITWDLLIDMIKEMGMTLEVSDDILNALKNEEEQDSDLKPYAILITNGRVYCGDCEDGREQTLDAHRLKKSLGEIECRMPSIKEYVAHWILLRKHFNKFLYGANKYKSFASSTTVFNSTRLGFCFYSENCLAIIGGTGYGGSNFKFEKSSLTSAGSAFTSTGGVIEL